MADAPKRGSVWWYDFDPPDERRPVVVVSRDRANAALRQVHIVPVTTVERRHLPTAVELGDHECVHGFVMTDGLQMILKAALNHPIGRLTSDAMLAIGEALAITLDLDL